MYTVEQLKPKLYPEEKPSNEFAKLLAYNKCVGWNIYKFWTESWGYEDSGLSSPNLNQNITWFIDIRYPPYELKPLKYPQNKPSEDGSYMCHNKLNDEWFVHTWNGRDSFSWREVTDYFIPCRLDKENEMDINKRLDKIEDVLTELQVFLNGEGILPSVRYFNDDVVRREPELLQCPFCGGECYTWNPAENDWSVACYDCTYTSGCSNSESEAIRLHNLIADNARTQKES